MGVDTDETPFSDTVKGRMRCPCLEGITRLETVDLVDPGWNPDPVLVTLDI